MSKRQKNSAPSEVLAGRPSGEFAESLRAFASWFERTKRILPWRDEPTLYRVWISEIMLQQTQVVTVKPYFERFMRRFPTVESLASAPQEDVLAQWAGLGYYSRARNLHKGAQAIARNGFPRDRDGWLAIPGVGQYTAGAILSIALNRPEAILDGNVERVLSRVRRVARARGDAHYKARLWRLSKIFVTRAHSLGIRPSDLNQALMELGATLCTPRKPACLLCPLSSICKANRAGETEAYPPRKKPKQWIQVQEELHCVLDGSGRVLLRQRSAGEWRAGLWDLPTRRPELPRGAERLGSVETRHVVTRHKISRVTHVWQCAPRLKAAEAIGSKPPETADLRWVKLTEPEVAVGSALKKTLQAVQERYLSSSRWRETN